VELEAERHTLQMDRIELVADTGSPAERITSIARDRGAGLIVLGLASEKEHAVRPGVIAYRVLCQSHVPVLVVPLEPRP
jgi:nucleotide-binding universal stress UspA family protein